MLPGPLAAKIETPLVTDTFVSLLGRLAAHQETHRQYRPSLGCRNSRHRAIQPGHRVLRPDRRKSDHARRATALTRVADEVPALIGNLPSTVLHALFFAAWIAINLGFAGELGRFDPYPFGLLSVIISLEAIFLTLFVLTSQNRQRARDRIRSDIEFESSINTEMKIARLHEKVDKLTEEHFEVLENTRKLLAGAGRRD